MKNKHKSSFELSHDNMVRRMREAREREEARKQGIQLEMDDMDLHMLRTYDTPSVVQLALGEMDVYYG